MEIGLCLATCYLSLTFSMYVSACACVAVVGAKLSTVFKMRFLAYALRGIVVSCSPFPRILVLLLVSLTVPEHGDNVSGRISSRTLKCLL